ncbi:hypothetical protein N8267_01480 [Pelagibacteraceae bacterium]|nr:hypothetical protein [Pelagibacteraceae bacterium]
MNISKNVKSFLKTNEKVVAVLTGNSYTSSPNPIVRLYGSIMRIISVILGSPSKKTIVCTNTRIIIENNQKILYIFDYSSEITAVAPRGIMQVGYKFQRSWIFFKNHYLTLILSGTPRDLILSRDGYPGVKEMMNAAEALRERVNK